VINIKEEQVQSQNSLKQLKLLHLKNQVN